MRDGWITIATFSTLAEAHLARQRLLDAGIGSVLGDVHMGGLGAHGDSAGGMKVEVEEIHVGAARQVLATTEPIPKGELEREALDDTAGEPTERLR